MKKRILAVVLTCLLLIGSCVTPIAAYSPEELKTADALYVLKLFLGVGETYSLDRAPTRIESIILMIRMLGAEDEAHEGDYEHPFIDVEEWADPYAAYAYETGITRGTGEDTLSGANPTADWMFLTFCLRALGYTDEGENPDFDYREARVLAQELGLVEEEETDEEFTRGDIVLIFWQVLNTCLKDSDVTLGEHLMSLGVFTAEQWEKAVDVEKNGKAPGDDSGEKSTVQKPQEQTSESDKKDEEKPSGESEQKEPAEQTGTGETEQKEQTEQTEQKEPTEPTEQKDITETDEESGEPLDDEPLDDEPLESSKEEQPIETEKLEFDPEKLSPTPQVGEHDHVPVIDPAVEPSCTLDGKTEGSHCSICGEILTEQTSIEAKGHNFVNGVCTGCGASEHTSPYELPEIKI